MNVFPNRRTRWAIFDTATGEPASMGPRPLIGLDERESGEVLAIPDALPKGCGKHSAA